MAVTEKEQLLTRWENQREIKNLMGRFSQDFTLREERKMFSLYWSAREDVCLGRNQGWYLGPDAVKGYYSSLDAIIEQESRLIAKAFPDVLGGKTADELHGVGLMEYRPLDTPVIEIAKDLKTAKGIWTVRGTFSKLTKAGPVAYWEWGWLAADFIKEPDGWKIWHLLDLDELVRQCGSPWTGPEKELQAQPEYAEAETVKVLQPTVLRTLRELYHENRPRKAPPRIPEPYDTFESTFSYGWSGGIDA